jgi:hypothetical protein
LAHLIVALQDALPDLLRELAVLDEGAHGQTGAADVLHVIHIQARHDVTDLLVQHVVGDEGLVTGHGDHEATRYLHTQLSEVLYHLPEAGVLAAHGGDVAEFNFVEPLEVGGGGHA